MSLSQNVIVKGDTIGGWIPIPKEMHDATGVTEAAILSTKQWGKVVPMMRAIGNYVMNNYLANDPRKNLILQWQSRYCTGANKTKKENMVIPVVGFVYILDSFKNHRGPSPEGRARNAWRKRMLAQINCHSVWRRTHIAIAKLIHNRFNLADSNPQKQFMKLERSVQRLPDIPWAQANYSNIGYPEELDDRVVEETAPSVAEATKPVPESLSPPLPPPPPPPDDDMSGEQIVDLIEQAKPNEVNKTDESGEPPSPPPSPPPAPPEIGTIPIPIAKTVQTAEGDYGDDSDDDDDDDDDEMPVITADGGYPDDGIPPPPPEPAPVEAETSSPPPPPPPPPPDTVLDTTVETASPPPPPPPPDELPIVEEIPPPPPPPPPSQLPITLSGEDAHIDSDDEAVLLTNAIPPPPPEPSNEAERISELETLIGALRNQIEEKSKEESSFMHDRQDLEDDIKRLNQLILQKDSELSKQKAQIEQFERDKLNWEKTKEKLNRTRTQLEEKIEELKAQQQKQKQQVDAQLDELNKRIEELVEASEQSQESLKKAENERELLIRERDELSSKNTALALRLSQLQADDLEERARIEEEDRKIQEQVVLLQQALEDKDNEITKIRSELTANTRALEDVSETRNNYEEQIAELNRLHLLEIQRLRAAITEEYRKQMTEIITERDKLRNVSRETDTRINTLQDQIEEKNNQILLLQQKITLTESRVREECEKQHASEIDLHIKMLEEDVRKKKLEIERLQGVNSMLQQRIENLELENNTLKETNQRLQENIALLQSELSQLPSKETVQQLRAQLEQNSRTANNAKRLLEIELNKLKEEKQNLESTLQSSNDRYQQQLTELRAGWENIENGLKAQIAMLKKQYAESKAKKATLDETVQTLQNQMAQVQAMQQTNERTINDLQQQLAQQKGINKNYEELLAQAQSSMEDLKIFYDQLKGRAGTTDVNEIIRTVDNIIKANDTAESKIRELEQTVTTKEEKEKVLSTQIDTLKREILTLQGSLEELKKVAGAYDQLGPLKGQTLTDAIRSLTNRLQELQTLKQQTEEKYNKAMADIATYNATAEETSTRMQQAASEIEQLQQDKRRIEEQINILTSTNTKLTGQYNELEKQMKEAETQQKQYLEDLRALEAERNKLQAAMRSNDEQHTTLVEKLNKQHQAEIQALKKQMNEKLGQIASLTSELERARLQIVEQNKAIQNLQRQLQEEKLLTAELKRRLNDVREANQDLESTLFETGRRNRKRPEPLPPPVQSEVSVNPPEVVEEEMEEEKVVPNPPQAELQPSNPLFNNVEWTETILDPESKQEITIYSMVLVGKDGHRKRVFLLVRWDLKGNPENAMFADKGGKPIKESDFGQKGIPFDGIERLKQFLQEQAITAKLREQRNIGVNVATVPYQKQKISQEVNEMSKDTTPTEVENARAEVNTLSVANENDNANETAPLFLNDPADLFNVMPKPGQRVNYTALIMNMLDKIFRWLKKLPPPVQSQILTDPDYVPPERLANIQREIRQYPSSTPVNVIQNSLISNVGALNARNIPNGFKKWLRRYVEAFNDGHVINLDPKLVYHTLASMIYKIIAPGPNSTRLTGFGYVPIPYKTTIPQNNRLYDYYGYGIEPFTPKYNNPTSYYSSDYHGY